MENNIQRLRKIHGLSHEEFSEEIKISTEELVRIECGVQCVRFDIAFRMSQFLQVPLEDIFPTIKKIPFWKNTKWDLEIYRDHDLSDKLEKVGFDTDACVNFVKLFLRGGHLHTHRVCSHNKTRLLEKVQTDTHSCKYVVYDTKTHRVALNLNHLIYAHFKFEPAYDLKVDEELDVESSQVFFTDPSHILELDVEPDAEWDDDEPPEWPDSQLGDLFYYAEMSVGEIDSVVMIKDIDGETAFLPLKEIAMVTVPLIYVEPKLFNIIQEDGFEINT